jgi:hypothetical protein
MNKWIRQIHRWVSVIFTLVVIMNFVALGMQSEAQWVGFLAIPPLLVLLLTGAYLFLLPYLGKSKAAST